MSNYLLELENEIILKWPYTYDKLRKSNSEHIITSFGISIKYNPCWYIFAEYDYTVITIDLYVVDNKEDFNQNIWYLTSGNERPAIKGFRHVQKYWIKPDEIASGFETIYVKPGDNPDRENLSILTVKQIINHISSVFPS